MESPWLLTTKQAVEAYNGGNEQQTFGEAVAQVSEAAARKALEWMLDPRIPAAFRESVVREWLVERPRPQRFHSVKEFSGILNISGTLESGDQREGV